MNKSVFLVFLIVVCIACTNEKPPHEHNPEEIHEYNPEEILRKIESNPRAGGVIEVPWDTPPEVVHLPPFSSKDLGMEGDVGLWISITIEGIVDTAWVIQPSEHPELDSLAVDLVRQFIFTPPKKNGKPIAVSIPFPFVFRD